MFSIIEQRCFAFPPIDNVARIVSSIQIGTFDALMVRSLLEILKFSKISQAYIGGSQTVNSGCSEYQMAPYASMASATLMNPAMLAP